MRASHRISSWLMLLLWQSGGGVSGWVPAPYTLEGKGARFETRQFGGPGDSAPGEDLCEVVGPAGRMGSFFLRQNGAVGVPRGVSPGCFSQPGDAIFVASPSKAWEEIYDQTLSGREEDLVFVGNGIPLDCFRESTVVVSHFGILSVGSDPVTSSQSPPTYVYGRHAATVKDKLDKAGISVEHMSSWEKLCIYAARKLLWASVMWLLCHSSDPPMTVSMVHRKKQEIVVDLVKELLPALSELTGSSHDLDLEETLAYLEAYSLSMPEAIPSKELAIAEITERNGLLLACTGCSHTLHKKLISSVAGPAVLEKALIEPQSSAEIKFSVEVQDLTLWGTPEKEASESAIVVGGGIIGTSIALNLARRGVNVTVFDQLQGGTVGATTPASWAWLNANQKVPLAYRLLNQLGMRGWRKDDAYAMFPSWKASLVQYKEEPDFSGGYSVEGPLARARLAELEPNANFLYDEGPIYFFAEEGCVDPAAAIRGLRQRSTDLGVEFISRENVTNLVRDHNSNVIGVASRSVDTSGEGSVKLADVVVVAAGTGSSSAALGGLPLVYSPGQVDYAQSSGQSSSHLKRILVDTVRESHVLERPDGTIVAGGGFLEVGASPKDDLRKSKDTESRLFKAARQLAPGPLQDAKYTHTAKAVRPMPRDGSPATGYLEPGLYTAVTHSGVTLAPILGALVATEISCGLSLDLLSPYRPSRLFHAN